MGLIGYKSEHICKRGQRTPWWHIGCLLSEGPLWIPWKCWSWWWLILLVVAALLHHLTFVPLTSTTCSCKILDVCFQAFPHGRAHNQFVGTLKAKVPVVGDEHNSSKTGIVLKHNFESKECTLCAPSYLVALCSPRGDWDSPKALGWIEPPCQYRAILNQRWWGNQVL